MTEFLLARIPPNLRQRTAEKLIVGATLEVYPLVCLGSERQRVFNAKDCAVSKAGFFRFFSLKRNSKPAADRVLYRSLGKDQARRFVEIGIGDGSRAENLISVALRSHAAEDIKYTGIDLFEASDKPDAAPLKDVHKRLNATGAQIRLVPGDARSALSRCANDLRGTDWVIISLDNRETALDAALNYLPRMLHKTSKVWIANEKGFEILKSQDITARMVEKRSKAA